VVDLDHTLIRTDCLHEVLVLFVFRYPTELWKLPLWIFKGRQVFKARVFARVTLDIWHIPVNDAVVRLCEAAYVQNRPIILATATPHSVAEKFKQRFAWISMVIGSTEAVNLTGPRKLSAILEQVSSGEFDFISDHPRDIPVWQAARQGWIVANRRPQWASHITCPIQLLPTQRGHRTWWSLIRSYQWVKNLLLFLPIIFEHRFTDWASFGLVFGGVVAFSAIASAMYVLNDLTDIHHDRQHLTKAARALASGVISIPFAVSVGILLLGIGFFIGFVISPVFGLILGGYCVANLLYSGWLKRVPIVDIFILSGFYLIRLISGTLIANVVLSNWLFAVSFFLFLSIGTLKRYSELYRLKAQSGTIPKGRGYHVDDLPVLMGFGMIFGVSATLVLGIYLDQIKTQVLYANSTALWGVIVLVNFWLMRLWFNAHRGVSIEDPVKWILKDRVTILIMGLCVALFWIAL
jgi:4-hydroxybenzoate polyprenyltransferase